MKRLITILSIILFAIQLTVQAGVVTNEARLEYNKGIDSYKLGQYKEAILYFKRAIEISPDYIDAYYNLGNLYEYLNQNDLALTTFQQLVVRNPKDYDALLKAAKIAQKLEKHDLTIKYASLIPSDAQSYDKAQELIKNSKISNYNSLKQYSTSNKLSSTEYFPQNYVLYDNLQGPTGLTADSSGNLYVACYVNNTIVKILPNGERLILSSDKRINGPIDIAIDNYENIYVANYLNNNVLKISKYGVVTVLIGNISKPYGLHLTNNTLYISAQGSNSVLKYKLKDN